MVGSGLRSSMAGGVVTGCLLLAGCVTTRTEVVLEVPVASASPGNTQVILRAIRDCRVFQEGPADPEVPSMGFAGRSKIPVDQARMRAIARWKNGKGKSRDEVLLDQGQNVTSVTRSLVRNALSKAGYSVVDAGLAGPDAWFLDVDIERFWAWTTLQKWTLTGNASIALNLIAFRGSDTRRISLAAGGSVIAFNLSDKVWSVSYQRAFDEFLSKSGEALAGLQSASP